jgi:hypothetical protein
MRKLTLTGAVLLLLVGLGLAAGAIAGFAGRYDIDLDRAGMAMVGFVYGLIGLLFGAGGWALLRKSRRMTS